MVDNVNFELSIEKLRYDSFVNLTTLNLNEKKKLSENGFYYDNRKIKCYACQGEIKEEEERCDEYYNHHKPNCSVRDYLRMQRTWSKPKKNSIYDGLRYETERLETFIDWPINWINPVALAAAGFYYLRSKDYCACVFCKGIVGQWALEDEPMVEHRKHFEKCPFLTGVPQGNIPADICSILDSLRLSEDEERPRPSNNNNNAEEYNLFVKRLKSFRDAEWPERIGIDCENMARAGFFYQGDYYCIGFLSIYLFNIYI